MEITKMECNEEHDYTVEFLETIENHRVTIQISFKEYWNLTNHKKDLLNDLGRVVGFALKGDSVGFPYNPKEHLLSVPLHIPHPMGRQMFKTCIDLFIKESNAPMHVSFADHPGYPVLVVTFASNVITEEVVFRVIASITQGIRSCETTKELIEKDDQETTDEELDEVDEDVVVEFDFDEEVKRAMKEPVSTLVQSMGGGMTNA